MTERQARAAILAAARLELAEHGAFSVNAVAARAGVSRQTVHYHFGGLKGLRAALAGEGFAEAADEGPTRERLIEAAIRVLSEPGGGVASIEAIAAEAGLTKGAFYHYFSDRTEFLRAVAARISPVREILAPLENTEGRPARDVLIDLATAYYRAINSRSGLIRNLATNSASDPELTGIVMAEVIGRGAPRVFAWFRQQVEEGNLGAVEPAFVIQALFGPAFLPLVLGPAVFEGLPAQGIRPATLHVEEYVDFVLHGAGTGTERTPPRALVSDPDHSSRPATSEVH